MLCWLLPAAAVGSGLVAPSDRVSSHLNVRGGAGVGNPVVGTLKPEECATILSETPWWYGVRLKSGTTGFVSKAWSRKIDHAIRIGAWNIKKLGHGSTKDYERVAHIIASEFDLMAVVEVMQKGGGHPGLNDLMEALGTEWHRVVTTRPRPDTTEGYAEFYAVVYRRALVRPCAEWGRLVYHNDNDGGWAGTGEDRFSREPAFGCFEVSLEDGTVATDFMIAAYHARWGDGKPVTIAGEVRNLPEVFESMARSRPGERDLFITGDFNLVPAALSRTLSIPVDTHGNGSTLNQGGALSSNVYDHFLVADPNASAEVVGPPAILDVRNVADTPQVFFRTVSDHLPVRLWLRADGPDDD